MRRPHLICLLIASASLCTAKIIAETPQGKYLDKDMPRQWSYNEYFTQNIPTDDYWWKTFDDPHLDSLIAAGVDNNYNIIMAAHRIRIAAQAVNSSRAAYFPDINLNAGWQKSQSSGGLGPNLQDASVSDNFALGLKMNWEIDLFGKITQKVKASKRAYDATEAEYAGVMTALCANIAKSYITLRMYQAEYQVAMEHIQSQGKILKIAEARHEAGLASMLDVTQAKTLYYSTQASVPGLESAIHSTINSIATLTGVYPDSIYSQLNIPRRLPDHRQIIPIGVPAQLLRRRPDIVQAESQLAQYAAQLGIEKKDFLPTLSLNASIGTSARDAGDLFKKQTLTYTIAPTLSWTIFDGLARKADVISAREQMEIGIDNYNLTVMNAVEEVDNAIASYTASLKNIAVLEDVIENSNKSLDLSLDLYKRGLNPFTDVVNAQLNCLNYENSIIESKGRALSSLITLYEALGGGWDPSQI
ncbi:MAG: efflux transporter outer membrane subunit [Bacteroides sp.]|nr:efflux transporter outer membrane subunit [Bacteroides sp.]MCM1390210.1 efflux transporter outer membrane subunit [Bacteroides sp.]